MFVCDVFQRFGVSVLKHLLRFLFVHSWPRRMCLLGRLCTHAHFSWLEGDNGSEGEFDILRNL